MQKTLRRLKTQRLLLSTALLTWGMVSFLSLRSAPAGSELWILGAALLAFILLFGAVVLPERRLPPRWIRLALLTQAVLVLYLVASQPNDISAILFILIATQLPHHFSKPVAMGLLVALNLAYYGLLQYLGGPQGLFTVLMYFLFQLFGFAAVELMLREQFAKEKLAAVNRELLATRYLLKTSTRQQERLRISRDLHDVLGHQLTALSLNLEVASHTVPDEHKPMLQQNLAQARQLLSDVRSVVREIRSEEQLDLAAALSELVGQLPQCRLSVDDDMAIYSTALKQQLLFCLQEGISNGLRHGGADDFRLSCRRTDDKLTLCLADNGGADNGPGTSAGSGLRGMEERLAPFDGRVALQVTSAGGRLTVEVRDSYDN